MKDEPIRAAYAANPRPGFRNSHLVLGDADRALCGVDLGGPAPNVTCNACLRKFQRDTKQGKRIAGQAAKQAIFDHITKRLRPAWDIVAEAFEEAE